MLGVQNNIAHLAMVSHLLLMSIPRSNGYVNVNVAMDKCQARAQTESFSYYQSLQIFSNDTNNSYIVAQPTVPISYTYEGSRLMCPQCNCTFCPYDSDTAPDNYWNVFDNPTSAYLQLSQPYNQMYGPCLDGKASHPMPCIQNALLHPPQILGVFYFPVQKNIIDRKTQDPDLNVPQSIQDLQTRFRHPFLTLNTPIGGSQFDNNGNPVSPSSWGMGKTAMELRISDFHIEDKATGQTDAQASAQIQQPYSGNKWASWAQMFCSAGCHRDTMYTQRYFTSTDDYGNDPRYAALQRYIATESRSAIEAPNCAVKCPTGQAVYTVDLAGTVYHPRLSTFWYVCKPWFGALPEITRTQLASNQVSWNMNFIDQRFDTSLKIASPTSRPVYNVSTFCPVNTFNRECADTKLRKVRINQNITAARCDSCPQGYHTNGSTGSWFCLPPLGLIFAQRTRDILKADFPYQTGSITNSTQWRHRNLSFFEFECGAPDDCYQCSQAICSECTPSEFNEQIIFGPFFQVSSCPQNSYCPDAVTVIQCPASKPFSPAGSWGLFNCTCKRGTYMSSNGTCVNCTASCPPGTYLPTSLCMSADGAVADAPCVLCNNYDPTTTLLADDQPGVQGPPLITEMQSTSTSTLQGYCNTWCKQGYQIDKTNLQCKPMTRIMFGNRVYYSQSLALQLDGYNIKRGIDSSLTNALLGAQQDVNSKEYNLIPDTICIINNITGIPTYPGVYVGYQPTPCVPCSIPQVPFGAYFKPIYPALDNSVCAISNVVCNNPNSFYLNATAWSCQSCSARQAQIGCPANTTIVGQGCANNFRPFNLSSPMSDCQSCLLTPLNVYNGKYLYTPPDGSSTCFFKDCSHPLNFYFPADGLCMGTSAGRPVTCNTAAAPCPANHFITSENRQQGCTSLGWLCQPCNYDGIPGTYYNVSGNCTTNGARDIQTQPCPLNHYCPGRGPPIPCPDIQITRATGTASKDLCFCPLGYTAQVVNYMTKCVYTPCANTTSLPNTPGSAKVSPYYMTMNWISLKTECSLCTIPSTGVFSAISAVAVGTTFGFASCACPPGYYGSLLYLDLTPSLQCLSCDPAAVNTAQNCGLGAGLPVSSCNTASLYVTNNNVAPFSQAACTTAYPPFSAISAGQYTCSDSFHFIRNPDPSFALTNLGITTASGSSLYTTQGTWTQVYAQQPDNICYLGTVDTTLINDMTVAQAIVSSSSAMDANNVEIEPPPFVFWIPAHLGQDTRLMVYATCANCATVTCTETTVSDASVSGVNINTPMWSWLVYPAVHYNTTYSSQAIAISAWVNQPTVQFYLNAAVAVVVLKTQGHTSSLELCVNVPTLRMQTDRSQSSLTVGNQTKFLTLPLSPTIHKVVDMVDSNYYEPVTTQPPFGVFFIAYNKIAQQGFPATCGVLVAGIQDTGTQQVKLFGGATAAMRDLCSLPISGSLTSVARTALLGITAIRYSSGTSLYLLYENTPNIVYVTQVIAPASGAEYPHFSTLVEYAYHGDQSSLLKVSSLTYGLKGIFRNMPNPQLITMANGAPCSAHAGDSSTNCLLVADSYQRTFVSIQDLPWGSTPSIIAGASITSVSSCSAATTYTNPSTLISTTIPKYWNGRQCVSQLCIRIPPCGEHQHFNGARCICDPGYFYSASLGCTACHLSAYCPGTADQQQYVCQPNVLQTTTVGAYSPKQCLCPISGYYYDAQKQICTMCTAGQYCPDQWNMFSCPAPTDVRRISSSASTVTPTGCVCQAGTYGATCQPCPQGMICPATVGSTMVSQGQLFQVQLAAASSNRCDVVQLQGSMSTTVLNTLKIYFNNNPLSGINTDNIGAYVYTNMYNTTNSADLTQTCMLLVTVHMVISSSNWISWLSTSNSAVFLAGTSNLISGLKIWGSADINPNAIVNTPTHCPVMQVPDSSSSYTKCVCAAGAYATSISVTTLICTACPLNTFTATPNTLRVCEQCDIANGFSTMSSGATNCTKINTIPDNSTSTTSDSSMNVAIIAGGSAAGLVILIGIIAFACTQTTTTTANSNQILRLPGSKTV